MEHNLRRLGDLRDFKVASDDPDVRGWDVRTRDGGRIGDVEELIVDPGARKVRYFEVGLDRQGFGLQGARRVSIPAESAEVNRSDRTLVLNALTRESIATLPESSYGSSYPDTTDRAAATGMRKETVIPRSEEQLDVDKRRTETGEVVVGKHVETEHVRQPVTVERERVNVERRPVQDDGRRSEARFGGEEIRVPIAEEELVVEKRPVVKEELVVSKETVRDTEYVDEQLRKERFDTHTEGHIREDLDRSRPRRGGE